jgi:glucose-6-phosphate 1-dehydrogenase
MAISDFDLDFFGGSGDLAMRKLLPAMYARDVANDLPASARIICVGREDISQQEFLQMIETNSKPHIKESVDEAAWKKFLDRITWVAVDAVNLKSYAGLAEALRKDESLTRVYYLATPPSLFARICDNLAASGLGTTISRVVLE